MCSQTIVSLTLFISSYVSLYVAGELPKDCKDQTCLMEHLDPSTGSKLLQVDRSNVQHKSKFTTLQAKRWQGNSFLDSGGKDIMPKEVLVKWNKDTLSFQNEAAAKKETQQLGKIQEEDEQSAATGSPSLRGGKGSSTLSLHDVLLYAHLPKAGGSFIRSTIDPVGVYHVDKLGQQVIAPEHVRILNEGMAVTEEDRRNTFTVGSVRNPCDYYVSLWAWLTRVRREIREFYGMSEEYYGVSEELNTTEDQRHFGKWLRWLMRMHDTYPKTDATPPGLLTARMLDTYFTESVANATVKLWGISDYKNSSDADRRIYVAAADSLDPSAVDCWIKTESLTSDLRTCLTVFEQQAGSNIVNFTAFDTLVALREQQHQETMDTGEGTKVEWTDGTWSTKNSGHQKCNFYFDYGGDLLKDYVYKADSVIFDKFGYQSCCSSDNA